MPSDTPTTKPEDDTEAHEPGAWLPSLTFGTATTPLPPVEASDDETEENDDDEDTAPFPPDVLWMLGLGFDPSDPAEWEDEKEPAA